MIRKRLWKQNPLALPSIISQRPCFFQSSFQELLPFTVSRMHTINASIVRGKIGRMISRLFQDILLGGYCTGKKRCHRRVGRGEEAGETPCMTYIVGPLRLSDELRRHASKTPTQQIHGSNQLHLLSNFALTRTEATALEQHLRDSISLAPPCFE